MNELLKEKNLEQKKRTEESFFDVVEERRAVRIYNQNIKTPEQIIHKNLELSTLAPSSSNMQLWEFYHIKSEAAKKKMVNICLEQSSAKTASDFVVAVIRPDKWKRSTEFNLKANKEQFGENSKEYKRFRLYYGKLMPFVYRNDIFGIMGLFRKGLALGIGLFRPITYEVSRKNVITELHRSLGFACMTFMYAMKADNYDTCPIGGFDSKRLKRMLNLPFTAEVSLVMSIGKAGEKGIRGERIRLNPEKVIKTI